MRQVKDVKGALSGFWLKIIAVIAMTTDHVASLFLKGGNVYVYSFMRCVGAMTFPIMAYLICEGYRKTSDLSKYKKRILIFSIASMLPYALAFGFKSYGLNVGFTLLFGIYAIDIYEKINSKILKTLLISVLCIASYEFDWGFSGVLLILMLYISEGKPHKTALALAAAVLLFVIKNEFVIYVENGRFYPFDKLVYNIAFFRHIGFVFAWAVICLYNEKRGRGAKYLFYAYYPLHLALLGIAARLLK